MQIDNMLMESVQLLVLGMGTVFCILLLLIAGLSLMSFLIAESPDVPPEVAGEEAAQSNESTNTRIVAVIQAAIHSYRSAQNR